MRTLLILFFASTVFVACNSSTTLTDNNRTPGTDASAIEDKQTSETERINQWFDAQFEEQLAFSPIQQTMLGRKTAYGDIDDYSSEATDKQLAWRRKSVAEMQTKFDRSLLSPEAQTSYDIWLYQLKRIEAAERFSANEYIFHQMQSTHAFLPQVLISFHAVDDAADMEAYISRIRQSGRAIEQLIQRSKDNAQRGARPPRFAFGFVINEAKNLISGAPFDDSGSDNNIWADAQAKISALQDKSAIDAQQASTLKEVVKDALISDWKPAYEHLISWQQQDRSNAPELSTGVGALPQGEAFYKERLANWTTTDLSADEIHKIGLAEVARLRAEMEKIRESVGFSGDLPAFFAYLRNAKDNERFYFPNTDAGRQGYIADATSAINRIKDELPNYFGLLPKADLDVKRVEAFREQDGAPQHYFPGTPDGSRNGIYYAHLSDMKAMPKRELEVIAYHEGLPGHHMQISIAQELEGIPTFRTQVDFGAYTEGWALYSELLATEMPGTYDDPYSDFGRIGSEIWRAIRLVVDTGLHAKGWSEEKAVQFFLANSAAPETQVRAEVRRYLVLPGQATSYKMGMLKILELREKAEAALGDAFDIRGFHDAVLGGGALPLVILERRINDWIKTQKSA